MDRLWSSVISSMELLCNTLVLCTIHHSGEAARSGIQEISAMTKVEYCSRGNKKGSKAIRALFFLQEPVTA